MKIILAIFLILFSTNAHAGIISNLVNWWTFDEGSGTTVNDSISYDTGTLNVGSGASLPSFINGISGRALSFNGKNYVDCGAIAQYTSGFTVSVWVYKTTAFSGSSEWTVIGNRNASNFGWQLGITGTNTFPNGAIAWRTFNGTSNVIFTNGNYDSTTNPGSSLNKWINIIAVQSSGSLTLYVNGNPVQTSSTTNPAAGGSQSLRIAYVGNGSSGSGWDGYIDDVQIYNRALISTEVTQLYNQNLGPVTTGASSFTGTSSIHY